MATNIRPDERIEVAASHVAVFEGFIFEFVRPTPAGTSAVAAPPAKIAKNAVVEKYDLRVTAVGNVYAAVSDVGQVRKTKLASAHSTVAVGGGRLRHAGDGRPGGHPRADRLRLLSGHPLER